MRLHLVVIHDADVLVAVAGAATWCIRRDARRARWRLQRLPRKRLQSLPQQCCVFYAVAATEVFHGVLDRGVTILVVITAARTKVPEGVTQKDTGLRVLGGLTQIVGNVVGAVVESTIVPDKTAIAPLVDTVAALCVCRRVVVWDSEYVRREAFPRIIRSGRGSGTGCGEGWRAVAGPCGASALGASGRLKL